MRGLTEVRVLLGFTCSETFLVVVAKKFVQEINRFIGDVTLVV